MNLERRPERTHIIAPQFSQLAKIVAISLTIFGCVYAIDHGVFVGTSFFHTENPGGGLTYNVMRCRYLFVTGISEIDAEDGQAIAPDKPPGFCRLFAK